MKKQILFPILIAAVVIGTIIVTKDIHLPEEHKDHPCAHLCYPANLPGLKIGNRELAAIYQEVERPVARTIPGQSVMYSKESFYDQAMPTIDPDFLAAAAEYGYEFDQDYHKSTVLGMIPNATIPGQRGSYCDCLLKDGGSFLDRVEKLE